MLSLVKLWMDRKNYGGNAIYYFEDGHKHKKEAEKFLAHMFETEENKRRYRYTTHAFLPKETPWLHPADLLAWQWQLECNRRGDPNRRPPRKDLDALLRPHDISMNYDKEGIASFDWDLEMRVNEEVRKLRGRA